MNSLLDVYTLDWRELVKNNHVYAMQDHSYGGGTDDPLPSTNDAHTTGYVHTACPIYHPLPRSTGIYDDDNVQPSTNNDLEFYRIATLDDAFNRSQLFENNYVIYEYKDSYVQIDKQ
jgi:hypothetical protein